MDQNIWGSGAGLPGLGRIFQILFQNGPEWSGKAPGLLFGGLGGPWDYYLGVWGPKIILKIVSFYRIVFSPSCNEKDLQ